MLRLLLRRGGPIAPPICPIAPQIRAEQRGIDQAVPLSNVSAPEKACPRHSSDAEPGRRQEENSVPSRFCVFGSQNLRAQMQYISIFTNFLFRSFFLHPTCPNNFPKFKQSSDFCRKINFFQGNILLFCRTILIFFWCQFGHQYPSFDKRPEPRHQKDTGNARLQEPTSKNRIQKSILLETSCNDYPAKHHSGKQSASTTRSRHQAGTNRSTTTRALPYGRCVELRRSSQISLEGSGSTLSHQTTRV